MNEEKITYDHILARMMAAHDLTGGDTIRLALCNQEIEQGMLLALARRLMNMFISCYGFCPDEIRLNPAHVASIHAQRKTLDVTFGEETAKEVPDWDLHTFPASIPLVGDETLDPFTVVAYFSVTRKLLDRIGELIYQAYVERFEREPWSMF